MAPHQTARVLKTLGCLILAALFAPSAQAATIAEIEVDPGSIGMASDGFVFSLTEEVEVVDITFSDGKSLGFIVDPIQLVFAMKETSGTSGLIPMAGFLTNENGRPIPGTAFTGQVTSSADPPSFTTADFPGGPIRTIWSGMLFVGAFVPGDYVLAWANEPTPVVVPEPGTFALLSLGLVGMGVRRRVIALS